VDVCRRAPDLHSVGLTFIGDLLGFGVAAAALGAVSATWVGVIGAAAILAASGFVIDLGFRRSARRHDGLWTLAALLWFVVGVPIAAYFAPGYSPHGFGSWVAVILIVTACEVVVSRASPWRTRWQR
jgi:hypothetical protein